MITVFKKVLAVRTSDIMMYEEIKERLERQNIQHTCRYKFRKVYYHTNSGGKKPDSEYFLYYCIYVHKKNADTTREILSDYMKLQKQKCYKHVEKMLQTNE